MAIQAQLTLLTKQLGACNVNAKQTQTQALIYMKKVILMEIVKLATLLHSLKTNKPTISTIYKGPITLTPTNTILHGEISQICHGVTTTMWRSPIVSNIGTNHHSRRR